MTENGSAFEFPCDVPVKIFGRNNESFRAAALATVRVYFPDLADDAINERLSKRDRFLSITVTVWVESRAQIDALYTELSSHELVLMVL